MEDRPIPRRTQAALRGGLIGSPETIRRKLRRFQSSNIDQVVLLNQAGRNTHEHICELLELFAREVMPEFQEAHPELLEVEAAGAEPRDRARGDRHLGLHRPLRRHDEEHLARPPTGGCRPRTRRAKNTLEGLAPAAIFALMSR